MAEDLQRGDTNQRLQSLLQFGLQHSDPDARPVDPVDSRNHVDLLNKIIASNPTDADRMRAAVIIINDTDSELEDRLTAWDELEFLLENLDNANDIQSMGLWPEIVKHLHSEEPEVVVQCLWVCGTAVQNNPKSQSAFLATNSLPTVISLISSLTTTAAVRTKAVYCLGSAINHNAEAYSEFATNNGWSTLDAALKDPAINCRRKAAFLINSLFQSTERPKELLNDARRSEVIATLIQSMSSDILPFGENGDQTKDADLTEYSAMAIYAILQRNGSGSLSSSEKATVKKALQDNGSDTLSAMAESEKQDFLASVES